MDPAAFLSDKTKRDALVIASKCCVEAARFNWYDANFLRRFEAAQKFLEIVAPDRAEEFRSGFEVLRTDSDFRIQQVAPVFDDETFERVRETVHALPYVSLEHYESGSFGRSLLRHHPFFTELQSSLTARMSKWVGEPVSPAYNFLSLYRGAGKCDPHLDQPLSKWTLDVCIEQSVEWPIFFSQVIDWPSASMRGEATIDELRADPGLEFEIAVLKPNQGVVFSGSSQWHFREPIGGRHDFCHLLFFHYLPSGSEPLAEPKRWAEHFKIPELDILVAADALVNGRREPSS